MIQPGPDTRLTGWDSSSGYHDSDSRIVGFSHTHLSGTGIPDYNDVLLMPTTSEVPESALQPGADVVPGYAAAFSHAEERASPGYYAVTLKDSGLRAELTTTLRVGLHRYSFPQGRPARVVLDLVHRDVVLDSALAVVGDRELAGHRHSRSWARDQRLFFVIRFSRPFTSAAIHGGKQVELAARTAEGQSIRGVFGFSEAAEPLLAVGISTVNVEGARRNLDAELPGWDFDATRRAGRRGLGARVGRIRGRGNARANGRSFTPPVPRMRRQRSDGRGRPVSRHGPPGARADGLRTTRYFRWDTFRPASATAHRPRAHADFVKTMLRMYQEGGRLPVWELAGNETDTMIGYHAVPVIADAILKGIGGFDTALAFEAMVASAEGDRAGLDAYKRRGYVDGADAAESVSRTLEYAYDDWCIAIVAAKLGRTADAARFLRRAQAWAPVRSSTGFMRPRVEGSGWPVRSRRKFASTTPRPTLAA
jgi:predicted alpha-1,2-mannosidase